MGNPRKIMKRDASRFKAANTALTLQRLAAMEEEANDDYDPKEQEEFNKSMDKLARQMKSKDEKLRAEAQEAWDDMVFYEKEKTERYLQMKAAKSTLPSKDAVKKRYAGISEARRAEDAKFHEWMGVKDAVDAEMKRHEKQTTKKKQLAQNRTISRNYEGR